MTRRTGGKRKTICCSLTWEFILAHIKYTLTMVYSTLYQIFKIPFFGGKKMFILFYSLNTILFRFMHMVKFYTIESIPEIRYEAYIKSRFIEIAPPSLRSLNFLGFGGTKKKVAHNLVSNSLRLSLITKLGRYLRSFCFCHIIT